MYHFNIIKDCIHSLMAKVFYDVTVSGILQQENIPGYTIVWQ